MTDQQIRVTPAQLRHAADELETRANRVQSAASRVAEIVPQLAPSGALRGNLADALVTRFYRVQPTLDTWPARLKQFADLLRQAAQAFEDADTVQDGAGNAGASAAEEAERQRMLDTWRRLEDDTIAEIRALEAELHGARGFINSIAFVKDDYERMLHNARRRLALIQGRIEELEGTPVFHGEGGTYDIDGDRYSRDDLLDQGPYGTCTAHAVFNSLIMRGYKITDGEARDIIKGLEALGKRDRDTVVLGIPVESGTGFSVDVAMDLFQDYGLEPTQYYTTDITDQTTQEAVQRLVAEVQSGDPVYVATTTLFNGGDAGSGHAMNVVGVSLDANGNLESVKVATNWSNGYQTISAETFLKDWANYGYYSIHI